MAAYAEVQTIAGLALMTQDRLEEPRGTGQFWNYPYEIEQFVTESLNEATLISGEPQTLAQYVPLTANSIVQSLPAWIMAIIRMETAGAPVLKTSLWHMDRFLPGWESTPAQATFSADPSGEGPFWFPLGFGSFGIYPPVSGTVFVKVSGIAAAALAAPNPGELSPPSARAYNPANLVVDPSFAGGSEFWANATEALILLPDGTTGAALEFTSSASETGIFSESFPLQAGSGYTYSAWIKTGGIGAWDLSYADATSGSILSVGAPTAWTFVRTAVEAPGPANVSSGALGFVNQSPTQDTITFWRPSVVSNAVSFQQEYGEAFADAAAASARLKDGTLDLQAALMQYEDFLSKMAQLSKFGLRKSGLRFTTGLGTPTRVTDVEKRF